MQELPEQQELWLDGNTTDFATGLLNSGACATLLAALAASGIAQQYGIPHNDGLAVHALQLAQVCMLLPGNEGSYSRTTA